jgi:hypothetical protein
MFQGIYWIHHIGTKPVVLLGCAPPTLMPKLPCLVRLVCAVSVLFYLMAIQTCYDVGRPEMYDLQAWATAARRQAG